MIAQRGTIMQTKGHDQGTALAGLAEQHQGQNQVTYHTGGAEAKGWASMQEQVQESCMGDSLLLDPWVL